MASSGRIRTATAVGLALWIALPIACAVALLLRPLAPLSGSPEPITVPVVASAGSTDTSAQLAIAWSAGSALAAPEWSGIVQTVAVSAGDVIGTGSEVAVVNGIRRIAVATPVPFFRPLARGDSGPDAEALNAVLSFLGLHHSEGDRFGGATEDGVETLAKSLGAGSDVVTFDPSWVVWLPHDGFAVKDASALRAGFPAPTPGAAILTSRDVAVAAVVVPSGTVDLSDIPASAPTVSSTLPTPMRLPVGAEVLVAQTHIAMVDGLGEVSPEGLNIVATAVTAGAKGAPAVIRIPSAADRFTVPTSAISDGGGLQCVLVSTASTGWRAVRVDIIADLMGQTLVASSELAADDKVVITTHDQANPCV